MTEIIENTFNMFYRWIFKENPEAGPKRFFKDLGIIGLCFATAKVLTGLANIAAGRFLGPHEYGRVNLVISAGMLLSAFLLVGITYSIVKYGVLKENQKKILSTAFLFSTPYILFISILIHSFKAEISLIFNITPQILTFAL
ncbi:MAG: hypothetical protein KAI33_03385 [Elusimicrobiales bacterium]|nr:hypothetical protein [Elusimicrobiales bacterium]